ncbi:MAG: hypothetical protein ACREAN_00495, partial [Nitrosopumilaceae archaeon]
EIKSRIMDEDEAIAFRKHNESLGLYALDYEDLLIHSQILIDRMAFLASLFMGVEPKGFAKQRVELTGTDKPFNNDIEYSRYIGEHTSWYPVLLNVYRNDFVIHNWNYFPNGLLTQPGESPRPVTRSVDESPNEEVVFQKLLLLRDKYMTTFESLAKVPLNYYELLDFFERHSETLSEPELDVLGKVRKVLGAKMPDPNEIIRHLVDFIKFFENHFLQQLVEKIA